MNRAESTSPQHQTLNSLSPLRLLAFGGLLLALAAGLLLLPPDVALPLFGALAALGLGYGTLTSWRGWTWKSVSLRLPLLRSASSLSVLAALAAMTWAAFLMRPGGLIEVQREGLPWLLLGIALLMLPTVRAVRATVVSAAPSARHAPIRQGPLLLGIAALAAVTQVNVLSVNFFTPPSPWVQMALFVSGCLGVVLGLGGLHLRQISVPMPHFTRETVLLLLILGLALLLRLWNLEYAIYRLVDEIHFFDAVSKLWYSPTPVQILLPHGFIAAFPWLYPFMQMMSSDVLGPSLAALRLPSVFLGLVQVLGVYYVGRIAFGSRAGLLAALALAVLPVHVHFSRLGLNNIAEATFAIWGFYALLLGFKSGGQAAYAVAGVLFGLTQYFYEGGRLFYALFALLWFLWSWLSMGQGWRRPTLRQALIFISGLVLVLLPLYYTWVVRDLNLFPRFAAVGGELNVPPAAVTAQAEGLIATLLQRLEIPLLSYVGLSDRSSFFGGDTAFVPLLIAPIFLLGLAACVWRPRHPGAALVGAWVLGVAVANSFIPFAPQSPRYVVVFPALALAIGLGFDTLSLIWREAGPRWRKAGGGLLLLLALGTAGHQIAYYFGEHIPTYYTRYFSREFDRNIPVKDFDDALFRIVELPPNTDAHILSPGVWGAAGYAAFLRYYGRLDDLSLDAVYRDAVNDDYLRGLNRTRNHAFFIEPNDGRTYARLERFFRLEGPFFSTRPTPPDRQFALYLATLENNLGFVPPMSGSSR